MSTFELSEYQKRILDFIKNENGNLLVDAKAGSGKTSTLVLIADEIIKQNKKCLFLAFNKSIVEELKTKIISDSCQIKTLHSLGLSFLRSFLYKKHGENYVIDIDQHDEMIKQEVEKLFEVYCRQDFNIANAEMGSDDRDDLYYNLLREVASMVNYSRLYNCNYHEPEQLYDLAPKLCWYLKDYEDYGMKRFPEIVEKVIDGIKESFENPVKDEADIPHYRVTYTDMIYFPCLYKMRPPFSLRTFLDYVLIDETQDLSVLQQMFVKLFVGYNTRMIAVGDEKQAIYGFAGADTKSIKNLKKNFDLTELPLNICYRCPKNVIKLAQDIVPSIDWNHKREDDGIVDFIDDSNLKDKLQPGDVILARRNNDLVRLYKKLVLDEKISIKFKNQEMVTTIVNEIKKVIKEYIKRYNAYANVEKELYRLCDEKGINWRKDDKHLSKTDKSFMQSKYKELVKQNKQISKQICKSNYNINYLKTCMDEYKEKGEYAFTYDGQKDNICVEYFDVIESLLEQYRQNESGILVNDFIVYTESFLKGNIYKEVPILSSIHMMKGGEADNVFIIDYPRFPYVYSNQTEDAQQQEKNLQYVALTRPKKNLYLCRISRCRNRETEEDIDRLNTKCEFDVRAALKRGEG